MSANSYIFDIEKVLEDELDFINHWIPDEFCTALRALQLGDTNERYLEI